MKKVLVVLILLTIYLYFSAKLIESFTPNYHPSYLAKKRNAYSNYMRSHYPSYNRRIYSMSQSRPSISSRQSVSSISSRPSTTPFSSSVAQLPGYQHLQRQRQHQSRIRRSMGINNMIAPTHLQTQLQSGSQSPTQWSTTAQAPNQSQPYSMSNMQSQLLTVFTPPTGIAPGIASTLSAPAPSPPNFSGGYNPYNSPNAPSSFSYNSNPHP
jgi:hypothetical protein